MEFDELVRAVGDETLFETGLLLASKAHTGTMVGRPDAALVLSDQDGRLRGVVPKEVALHDDQDAGRGVPGRRRLA